MKDIMRHTGAKVLRSKLPSLSDIEEIKSKNFIDEINTTIRENTLTKYINIVEGVVVQYDVSSMDVAAALLKMSLFDTIKDTQSDFDENYSFERERKVQHQPYSPSRSRDADMVRLFINIGKNKRVSTKDVVGAIANEGGISGRDIGSIDIFDEFTFVDIPQKHVKAILKKMKNTKIRGAKINIEVAKKSKRK